MRPSNSHLWRLSGEALALCYRAAAGYEACLTPGASLVLSGEPVADLNYAFIDAGPQAEARLRGFVQTVEPRGIPAIFVFTPEVASQLAPVAIELGLQFAEHVPYMVYRPSKPCGEQSHFEVARVDTEEDIKLCNIVAARGFGIAPDIMDRTFGPSYIHGPGLDVFIGRQRGVAVSTVQTVRSGDAVGIWAMATMPDQQRKGAGAALLKHVIAHHYERGAGFFYLGATPAGKPLYERVGFQTVSEASCWVYQPSEG